MIGLFSVDGLGLTDALVIGAFLIAAVYTTLDTIGITPSSKTLRRQNGDLRERNQELEDQVHRLMEQVETLQGSVRVLNEKIAVLESRDQQAVLDKLSGHESLLMEIRDRLPRT